MIYKYIGKTVTEWETEVEADSLEEAEKIVQERFFIQIHEKQNENSVKEHWIVKEDEDFEYKLEDEPDEYFR